MACALGVYRSDAA